MAAHLGVSSAYLSALERGERGKPTWTLLQGVLQYFNIIWDEADELARLADLSDPQVKIDTAGCDPAPRSWPLASPGDHQVQSGSRSKSWDCWHPPSPRTTSTGSTAVTDSADNLLAIRTRAGRAYRCRKARTSRSRRS